jgi:glutamate-5-semialdehyde dehydrogenase
MIGREARRAAQKLACASGAAREAALRACAAAIRHRQSELQSANRKDMLNAQEMGLTDAMMDRLHLSETRIEAMAAAIEQIAAQRDPVGKTITAYNTPDGLRIEKRRVPIGVIGIIYESRPNVTAEAAALCLKSGNACILRGGKEALHSNLAIASAIREGLLAEHLPPAAVTVIDRTDREIVQAMCTADEFIDLIIPRGGEGLIRAVVESATVPVIKHYTGNCHIYVHADADQEMALKVVMNAKCQRPGVCNAMETLLVDKQIATKFLPLMAQELSQAGVEIRGCEETRKILPAAKAATEEDWRVEYLELILAVKVVDGLDDAIRHINTYGSRHTDAIITRSLYAAQDFVARVDSASVMVNASTRLADGGIYGLGAEVGISTDKLHARGPMGAEDLTTYKWVVTGQGHVRQ